MFLIQNIIFLKYKIYSGRNYLMTRNSAYTNEAGKVKIGNNVTAVTYFNDHQKVQLYVP